MKLWQILLAQTAAEDELSLCSFICSASALQAVDAFFAQCLPALLVLIVKFTRWLDPAAAIAGNDAVE